MTDFVESYAINNAGKRVTFWGFYYVSHGYGVHRIASTLNAEGIKTRSGKNWHHASLNGMIRNVTYTGVLRSGKSRSNVTSQTSVRKLN